MTSPARHLALARDEIDRPELAEIAPAAALVAATQIAHARERLGGDPAGCVLFPFRDLDLLAGPVRPGRLVFVMANTGQGKTTFLLNLTRRLLRQAVPEPARIDYLGTEQMPDELWTKLACLDANVPPDIAINLAWDRWHDPEAINRVDAALEDLNFTYGATSRLRFVPDKFITLARVEMAARDCADAGHTLLIVDHIDRIETDGDDYAAMRVLVRRMKELARDYDIVIIAASQSNRKGREGDRLAVYRPPRLETMRGGGVKEEEADVVLGLFRPIAERPATMTAKEWTARLSSVRKGEVPASEIVSSDRMGVCLLKHRTRSNEGAQCFLRIEHGVASDESVQPSFRM
jgi:replicative DNA helicase